MRNVYLYIHSEMLKALSIVKGEINICIEVELNNCEINDLY